MSWELLVWLVAFVLQAALLGIVMYQLISLSDLENDFTNPHDASSSVNRWVLPEYGLQAALTTLLLLNGKWVVGSAQLVATGFNLRTFMLKQHLTDVTEIYPQLPREKRLRICKGILYLGCFIIFIYKLVEVAVHSLLTPEGRKEAAKMMKEAAAGMPY